MTQSFHIVGMTCQGCVSSVKRVVSDVPGVTTVQVSLDDNQAVVDGDAPAEAITAAIEAAGFDVRH